jgi:Bacterial PH domain
VPSLSRVAPSRGMPAADREVYRLGTPVVLWWVWVAFAAANIIDLAVQRTQGHTELVIDAIVLLVTGFAYALALRPRVIADQAGVTVMNPFRDHYVPWAVIQAVDTGDWVKVHHTRDGSAVTAIDVPGKAIECWALYLSARTKRKEARPGPPRARSGLFGGIGTPGPQESDGMSRLPAEARYLASLPPARAIAATLDTRVGKERAKARKAGSAQDVSPGPTPATARWAWFPLAAIAIPALALLIALLT